MTRTGRDAQSGQSSRAEATRLESTSEAPSTYDQSMRFSDLLWIAHEQHRLILASAESTEQLNMRHHRMHIPYHVAYKSALCNLGLYQIAQMADIDIDAALMTGLVERWRPETHTFHLPVGEMTVTLQDVSCLWGLPIQGVPITGISDGDWDNLLEECLGIGPSDPIRKRKRRKTSSSAEYRMSEYSLSLKQLRTRFGQLPEVYTPLELDRYTRAYILDLFGSVMFSDTSGDSVPIMYLSFLRDLETPICYNWGGAVLAYLYHSLCMAAAPGARTLSGPVVLLQHWSWTRLPICRPRPRLAGWSPIWGHPDQQTCPAFGAKWCSRHTFVGIPHGATSGVSYVRNQLQMLTDEMVDWEPYVKHMQRFWLPQRCQLDRDYWLARVPMIHFWIVEHHYPDRVMRQFGLRQMIPPLLPLPEDVVSTLHRTMHGQKNKDWSIVHAIYVQHYMAHEDQLIHEEQLFDDSQIVQYRRWFQATCMHTVFLAGMYIDGLRQPIPIRRDQVGPSGYIPSGPPITRMALRAIRGVAHGIKMVCTKGWRLAGKNLLRHCAGSVEDAGFDGRLHAMLDQAGLPHNWEEISSDESEDATNTPMPAPPTDVGPHSYEDWLYSSRAFDAYMAQHP